MTYINEGITSAKRQTWDYGHREALRRMVKANPVKAGPPSEADEAKWRQLYREEIQADEEPVLACIDYCFHSDLRALLDDRFAGKKRRRKTTRAGAKVAAARNKTEIEAKTQRLAPKLKDLVLLDLMMPNGKALGQCTGEDCGQFHGWFKRLAKLVPSRKDGR
jgi:hypothetical protein